MRYDVVALWRIKSWLVGTVDLECFKVGQQYSGPLFLMEHFKLESWKSPPSPPLLDTTGQQLSHDAGSVEQFLFFSTCKHSPPGRALKHTHQTGTLPPLKSRNSIWLALIFHSNIIPFLYVTQKCTYSARVPYIHNLDSPQHTHTFIRSAQLLSLPLCVPKAHTATPFLMNFGITYIYTGHSLFPVLYFILFVLFR